MKNELRHSQRNVAKWDNWAKSLDDPGWRNNYLRKAQSELISLLGVKENQGFLDVGCGTGWALGQIARSVNGKGQFYGVDLSPKMIEKARDNFKDADNFHFIQANAEAIPLDGNFFDTIICTNSFHHYLNPVRALQEMRRLLKSGGKVHILDPTADSWLIRQVDKLISILGPAHVKMYSTREFQKLYSDVGLGYKATRAIGLREKVHIGEKPRDLR